MSDGLQQPSGRLVCTLPGTGSKLLNGYGYVNHLVLLGQLPAFIQTIVEAELNRLFDVGKRSFSSLALADAPRDDRALGHDPAIVARREHYGKVATARVLHAQS